MVDKNGQPDYWSDRDDKNKPFKSKYRLDALPSNGKETDFPLLDNPRVRSSLASIDNDRNLLSKRESSLSNSQNIRKERSLREAKQHDRENWVLNEVLPKDNTAITSAVNRFRGISSERESMLNKQAKAEKQKLELIKHNSRAIAKNAIGDLGRKYDNQAQNAFAQATTRVMLDLDYGDARDRDFVLSKNNEVFDDPLIAPRGHPDNEMMFVAANNRIKNKLSQNNNLNRNKVIQDEVKGLMSSLKFNA